MVHGTRFRAALLTIAVGLGSGLGLAAMLREARASGPTPLLPDVVADPPDNVTLAVSDETPTEEPTEAKLLLRFNGYVHNVGPGALDFRGSRQAPTAGKPASPPMNVFQRIYNSDGTYTEQPSKAEMVYVDADGHHHWHLQHVAYYSLWNAAKSAEMAPAQKVGFCLEDSERVEGTGPSEPVYSDGGNPPREFCRQYQPEATSVFEGVSEGWRDLYRSDLAFQWVDVSDVLPGEYWLRAQTDPEHLIQQTGGEKPPAYATAPTVIPGFDAQSQSRAIAVDHPLTLTLTSQRWSGEQPYEQPSPVPSYAIVGAPLHGALSAIAGDQVVYTPSAGFEGIDSFTFAARDPQSSFPLHPAVASVSIDVTDNPPRPSVAIAGVPASMIAGTSVQLSASVSYDTPTVQWSASGGTITQTGLYTAPPAPPPGGAVTVAAESPGGGRDQRTIVIQPLAPPAPQPEAPVAPTPAVGTPPSVGVARSSAGALSTPEAVRIGRRLYMTAIAGEAGRLRLTALLHGHRIASCVERVRRRQSFTCVARLSSGVPLSAPISVWATLRVGSRFVQRVRRAGRVPTAMQAARGISWRAVGRAWRFFCGM
jgi:hypothetical protein